MDSIAALRLFLRVADCFSFVEAARGTGLTPSAVGKSIQRLEEGLGVRLLHRSTRSMSLTTEGLRLLGHARRITAEADAALDAVVGTAAIPRGTLRVSLPVVGALFDSTLQAFAAAAPEVRLEAVFTDAVEDPVQEGYDVVVRIGEPDETRLKMRRLGAFRMRLVASPAYLSRCGGGLAADRLWGHHWLLYRYPSTGRLEVWPVAEWGKLIGSGAEGTGATICNSIDTLLRLAQAGSGIAWLPEFLVHDALEAGSMIVISDNDDIAARPLSALWPGNREMPAKTRLFIDLLQSEMHGVLDR